MLEEKKKELQRLIEVEIPRNSKEVGFALSLGDLRENSEYKAAKEETSPFCCKPESRLNK